MSKPNGHPIYLHYKGELFFHDLNKIPAFYRAQKGKGHIPWDLHKGRHTVNECPSQPSSFIYVTNVDLSGANFLYRMEPSLRGQPGQTSRVLCLNYSCLPHMKRRRFAATTRDVRVNNAPYKLVRYVYLNGGFTRGALR